MKATIEFSYSGVHTTHIIKSNYEIYMFDEDLLACVHGHYDY